MRLYLDQMFRLDLAQSNSIYCTHAEEGARKKAVNGRGCLAVFTVSGWHEYHQKDYRQDRRTWLWVPPLTISHFAKILERAKTTARL